MNCVLFHCFTPGLAQGLLHKKLLNVEQCNLSKFKLSIKINVGKVNERPIKPIILFLTIYNANMSSGRNLEAFEKFSL